MRIKTADGEIFDGQDAREIVRQMKNTMWNSPDLKREYMESVVSRVTSITAIFPDPDASFLEGDEQSAQNFLDYLTYSGVISLVEDRS